MVDGTKPTFATVVGCCPTCHESVEMSLTLRQVVKAFLLLCPATKATMKCGRCGAEVNFIFTEERCRMMMKGLTAETTTEGTKVMEDILYKETEVELHDGKSNNTTERETN